MVVPSRIAVNVSLTKRSHMIVAGKPWNREGSALGPQGRRQANDKQVVLPFLRQESRPRAHINWFWLLAETLRSDQIDLTRQAALKGALPGYL
uniref:Transposase n=1 Tax=Panagrellus redivivus TaxID=6233 RepID=A0A7E4VQD1_PANRE